MVAAEPGTVELSTGSARAGCMLWLHGQSGTRYAYIHLNNDLTEGNDNRGGCKNGVAYAPGLSPGQAVGKGQLLGFVGDSGDANGGATHLHFELHPNGGAPVSPFRWLRKGVRLLYARPASGATAVTLRGRVLWSKHAHPSDRLAIRVGAVKTGDGLVYRPARRVVLSVPSGSVIEREAPGAHAHAHLEDAVSGERVIIQASPARSLLKAQRGAAGALAAGYVLLGG